MRVQVLPSMFVESKNLYPGIGPAVVVDLVVLMIFEPELHRFEAEHELFRHGQTGHGLKGRPGRLSGRDHYTGAIP